MLAAFDRMGAMIRHFKKVRKRLSVKYPGFLRLPLVVDGHVGKQVE